MVVRGQMLLVTRECEHQWAFIVYSNIVIAY